MLHTNFSTNWNNKLLSPCFGTIRVDDTYELNQEREIRLRCKLLGTAKVVSIRSFPFSQLSDNVCYVDAGQDANYMATVLRKMHGELEPYRLVRWVIFKWVQPNLEAMREVYASAWERHVEQFTISYRDTPEAKQLQFTLNI